MITIGTVLIPQLLILYVIYRAYVFFRAKGVGYFDFPPAGSPVNGNDTVIKRTGQ